MASSVANTYNNTLFKTILLEQVLGYNHFNANNEALEVFKTCIK